MKSTMHIDDELRDFFSSEVTAVIADSDTFRRKLGIGSDAFKILTRAEATNKFVGAACGGAGIAGAAYAGWFASLGVLGQMGVAVGLVSTPLGWVGAAGATGAGMFLLTRRLLNAARREMTEEIPRFINTPLDVIGASICDILAPALCKIVIADGVVEDVELERVTSYFCAEWGFDRNYIDCVIKFDAEHFDDWDWSILSSLIGEVEKTGDVKSKELIVELQRIAEEVALCDGSVSDSERHELSLMRSALTPKNRQSFQQRLADIGQLRPFRRG